MDEKIIERLWNRSAGLHKQAALGREVLEEAIMKQYNIREDELQHLDVLVDSLTSYEVDMDGLRQEIQQIKKRRKP